ncbi:MAG: hypothetical protein AAF685_02150 [Cyanobacteria bacterium P01_C01_bin.89]
MQSLPPQLIQKTSPMVCHGQSTLVVVVVVTEVLKTAECPKPVRRRDRLAGALRSGTRALIEELPGGEVAIALWDGWRHPGRSQ